VIGKYSAKYLSGEGRKYERAAILTPKSANFDTFYPKKCNLFQFLPPMFTKKVPILAIFPQKSNLGQFSYSESIQLFLWSGKK